MWDDVLTVAALSYGALVVLSLVVVWVDGARELVRELRARRRATRPREWSMTLLVERDETADALRPSLELTGGEPLKRPAARVELVDPDGATRAATERALDPSELGGELTLPAVAAADAGALIDELLAWTWEVVLEDGGRERARWRERLHPADATNPEAELSLDARPTRSASASLYVSGDGTPPPRRTSDRDAGGKDRWWQTPFGRWRLSAEVEAMRRFPDFNLERSPTSIRWLGRLESTLTPGRSYVVSVAYPHAFPDEAPRVRIEEPELPASTPHLVLDNAPCLYHSVQGPRHGYDPARTTAATLVAWTALWLHAYETWKATGMWPGSGK